MLELAASDERDAAAGSRFPPESRTDGGRGQPTADRVAGTSLLRLLMRRRLRQAISDGTSGLYAVDQKALSCSPTISVRGAGGGGADAHHRRQAAAGGGAGAHAPA